MAMNRVEYEHEIKKKMENDDINNFYDGWRRGRWRALRWEKRGKEWIIRTCIILER